MTLPVKPLKSDPLAGWRRWVAENEQLISELIRQGCSRGEALLIIEMNQIEQGFRDLGGVLHSLVQELDDLAQAFDRPDGEDWKGP